MIGTTLNIVLLVSSLMFVVLIQFQFKSSLHENIYFCKCIPML